MTMAYIIKTQYTYIARINYICFILLLNMSMDENNGQSYCRGCP